MPIAAHFELTSRYLHDEKRTAERFNVARWCKWVLLSISASFLSYPTPDNKRLPLSPKQAAVRPDHSALVYWVCEF